MRLGREASHLGGKGPTIGGRIGSPVHGSICEEQHQCRKGILQLGGGHQKEDHRYLKNGPRHATGGQRCGSE